MVDGIKSHFGDILNGNFVAGSLVGQLAMRTSYW